MLSEVLAAARQSTGGNGGLSKVDTKDALQNRQVNSLLENDLEVPQPLHISLSRPLVLKTTQKDAFLTRLKQAIADSNVKAFDIQPKALAWHPNEGRTRWFLVLRLQKSPELSKLLEISNGVAGEFGQPLLFAEPNGSTSIASNGDPFHISIAWSLNTPGSNEETVRGFARKKSVHEESGIPYELLGRLSAVAIHFGEMKVRIGQDVHSVALKVRR